MNTIDCEPTPAEQWQRQNEARIERLTLEVGNVKESRDKIYGRKSCPVECVETGERFASMSEAARRFPGCTCTNIRGAVRYGFLCRGFHWKYVDQPAVAQGDSWGEKNQAVYDVNVPGDRWPSLAALAREIRSSPSNLRMCISEGWRCKGRRFAFVE